MPIRSSFTRWKWSLWLVLITLRRDDIRCNRSHTSRIHSPLSPVGRGEPARNLMFANWWEDPTLIYWIAGFVAFYFIGTPLLVLFGQKMSADPACEELKMHSLDPQISQFLMDKTN